MLAMRTLIVALCLYGLSAASGFCELQTGGAAIAGGVLTVTVAGTYRQPVVSVELRNHSWDILSENLPFYLPEAIDGALYAVLGLPDSLAEGSYVLTATSGNGTVMDSCWVTVTGREFKSETIHLNNSMSLLRRDESMRRFEESKQLGELLSVRNGNALHHFGGFHTPVEGARITSYFGDRRLFVYADASSARAVHAGVDLAAPEGTPITSSGRGEVVFAGNRLITGNTVVVEHLPGVYSLYYHLADLSVVAGDLVTEESVIGTLGSTGVATGPHLHWEIRVGGIGVDPFLMVDFSL